MVEWYKHDIPAWMDGTQNLSCPAYRIYHVVCQLIYQHEGPITFSEHTLAGICGQHVLTFRKHFKDLVDLGKLTVKDGKISNPRAETELQSVANRRATSARGGRGSAGVTKRFGIGSTEVDDRSAVGFHKNYNKNNDEITVPLPDNQHHKSRREKTREEKKDGARAPCDLFAAKVSDEKQYFDRSKEVLGPKANGMAARLLKSKGKIIAVARAVIETASTKSEPLKYVAGVVHASEKAAQTQDDDSW